MKRFLVFTALFLVVFRSLGQPLDTVMLSRLKLNFVVPDMPAFKALGTEPSNLLRPSTPNAIALSLSEFYEDQQLVIPRALAVEVSPSLLLNAQKGPQQLQQYARNRVLNSFRVSLGSAADTLLAPKGRSLALGCRINLVNQGEFVTDREVLNRISQKLAEFRVTERDCRRQFAIANLNGLKKLAGDEDPSHTSIDQVMDWDFFLNRALSQSEDTVWRARYERFKAGCNGNGQFDQWLEEEKDNYKKTHWNAPKLDLGLAVVASGADSLLTHVHYQKTELWLTLALPAGKNAQLLLGLSAQAFRNLRDTAHIANPSYLDFSIPFRYLIGTNRVKGYAELQYDLNTLTALQRLLLNLGAELNIRDGIWVNMYGGLDYSPADGSASFNGSFKMKLTLPENFRLF